MSPLSFIHADGSSRSDSLNKKLVRAHVSKYFHPKKQGKQAQLNQVGGQQPRLLAPIGQLTIQPRLQNAEDITISSLNEDRNELEEAFPDTITAVTQSSKFISPESLADNISLDGFLLLNH